MGIVHTTGTLDASTGSTGTQLTLTGQAKWIYLAVSAQTYVFFAGNTNSTGTGTGLGLTIATGDTYVFQFHPGDAKYLYHVATAANPYSIMEVM
jgi:hypothetical protein